MLIERKTKNLFFLNPRKTHKQSLSEIKKRLNRPFFFSYYIVLASFSRMRESSLLDMDSGCNT